MNYKVLKIEDILVSVSETKKITSKKIIFLNTSDIEKGKIIKQDYMEVSKLPGQAKKSIKNGDILYSEIRPKNGRYCLVNGIDEDKYVVSTKLMVLRCISNTILNEYLYYYLTSKPIINYLQGIAESRSGTFPQITFSELSKLKIKVPDIKYQIKIVEFIKQLDSKIELNSQIISNLEELASTLFKRWFVDFEFPDENGNPYKSSGGKMVDSELGKIPEGWEATSLSDIANYKNGLAMQKFRPDENEKSLPVLKIKELNQGFTDSNSDRCSIDISDEVKIENGDVVFSWSGTLLVKIWTGGDAGLNQHLFKVTSNKFPKWYYYLWTKFYMNKFIGIAKDKATTMGHIKRQHLSEAKVIIPSINMLEKFGKVLGPTIDMITEKGIENLELSNLRDSLLPKLLSGEIELPEDEGV
ncbi:TPA: restriction endonuclease subunit S [Enterococcus faecium]|uniref:restriction endonuclease subunit S n=1 Tax=Enterococcus TaxID=1350 RepID=UPI00027C7A8A|nr:MULTISPECIES: restriction endonuclease subunit S [Enterococcus]EGP5426722.1 restriction endonuclease subunit S [Enterococcus faecium]EGP5655576.1 restriction endonuclease subunit S [Enterococcus faecium]EGP5693595.1 restriction endonuclease subunit S [Enterococcus faecium]EJV50941.1 type I restriction modification DNA specificity domain protein [Enterococcus faecium TX1337RF]MCD9223484.1 restriction endonuclease subunit S [Enterococcus lactis]